MEYFFGFDPVSPPFFHKKGLANVRSTLNKFFWERPFIMDVYRYAFDYHCKDNFFNTHKNIHSIKYLIQIKVWHISAMKK